MCEKIRFKKSIYTVMNSKYFPFFVGLTIVLCYYVPYLILGEESWVRIHDCLDDRIAHIKMCVDNGGLFDGDKVLPILYGIKSRDFSVAFSLQTVLFLFMPAFKAYVAYDLYVRVVAFIGMYLLLTQYVIGDNKKVYVWICVMVSVCFAYISFYTIYGLSSAGIPLILYAFYNLKTKRLLGLSYMIIVLFALTSSLVLSGLFFGLFLIVYYGYTAIREKSWNYPFLIGICVLGFVYLIQDINLFYTFFFKTDYISHRTEFYSNQSFHEIINNIKDLFWVTQYHAGILRTKTIVSLVLIASFAQLRIDRVTLKYFAIVMTIILLCLIANILKSKSSIVFLHSFQFDRFYFMLPSMWLVVFACALRQIADKTNVYLASLFVVVLLFQIYHDNQEFMYNFRQMKSSAKIEPNFRQFYDEDLFNMVAKDIAPLNRNECRVASIGIYPSVAEYNGFYTVDGYVGNYKLEYKHQFREVIKNELYKDDFIKGYFDNWGNRCYVYSFELNDKYDYGKNSNIAIYTDIDIKKLKELRCQYIISAVTIKNYIDLGLEFVGDYSHSESYWDIKVYKII